MFESYDCFKDCSRQEKRLIRENTIHSMRTVAQRICYAIIYEMNGRGGGDQLYETIRYMCPSFSPRERAMVRSIIVNDGVVDDNPIDWD